jgi:TolB-like protein
VDTLGNRGWICAPAPAAPSAPSSCGPNPGNICSYRGVAYNPGEGNIGYGWQSFHGTDTGCNTAAGQLDQLANILNLNTGPNAQTGYAASCALTGAAQLVYDPLGRPDVNFYLDTTDQEVLLGVAVLGLVYSLHRKQSSGAQSSPGPRSLAIIPFRNLRQDTDSDFLGFSLADAVATKLSYVSALTVRSSSAVEKYRDQVIDIQEVATDLNVDTLLTGNFVREGDDLRIISELIDVRTQRILWKEAFDLKYEKLLIIQESVAQQIVKGLEVNLSPTEAERMKADRPIDPLAYEYYLRGVDLYSRSDFPMAIKMLEKSTELNPRYSLTWAHLGRAYDATASFQLGGREQYQKAEAAYEKALSLQPAQIETRVYMANMLTDTGRVEQAVPLLREALKANPNHAEAHWIAQAYDLLGDRASALRVLQYSIETGFFSYPYLANDPLLHVLRGSREFDRMMEVARQRHESFKARFL